MDGADDESASQCLLSTGNFGRAV